jgi:hypothetical protein
LTSATLFRLSDGAERFFWRLTLVADDHGRFEADPQVMKAKCFPQWPDKRLSARTVAERYAELVDAELVQTYAVAGRLYGFFVTWARHQRMREGRPSKFPNPTPNDVCGHLPPLAANGGHWRPETRDERRETRDERETGDMADSPGAHPPGTHTNGVLFKIPERIIEAVEKSALFADDSGLRQPSWWQAEIRANPGVDLPAEVLKAHAWLLTHPERRKKQLRKFLHNWFARADRPAEVGP